MVSELQKRTAQAIVNIFETGSARGDYAAVTLLAGDAGHLTYGRSQTTLGSGNLHDLIAEYVVAPGARFVGELAGYLPRLLSIDFSLDNDMTFRGLLARAGEDPVMQDSQDAFFDRAYWRTAEQRAAGDGIVSALGVAIVYDSTVHGSWSGMRERTNINRGTIAQLGERPWLLAYLEERRDWMLSGAFAYSRITVFRMLELMTLAALGKWELELPCRVRTILLDENAVAPRRKSPISTRSPHSGFMVQGNFGQRGNFELATPHPMGAIAHYWRQNDAPGQSWAGPVPVGAAQDGPYSYTSLIQSNFTSGANKGNLEVIAREGGTLALFWREDRGTLQWHGPFTMPPEIFDSIGGNPALIQSRFGGKGNFELIVPRTDGGFSHYWRDNNDPKLPWQKSEDVGKADGVYQAAALVESTFTKPGTLEALVRRRDGRLFIYWREPAPTFKWHDAVEVPLTGLPAGTTASGVPGFIQSRHGPNGNYELVTPLNTGGMAHLPRFNDDPTALRWGAMVVFGQDAGHVDAASLVQSNLGTPELGDLEVAARAGRRTFYYRRSDQPPFEWSKPGVLIGEL